MRKKFFSSGEPIRPPRLCGEALRFAFAAFSVVNKAGSESIPAIE